MLLSVVIPVFNEAESLVGLLAALRGVLREMECDHELIFVNDGSSDGSSLALARAAAEDPRVRVLAFSRNFGHQAAITAGLDVAMGDAVVVMDADLQDPPELLPRMWSLYRQGYEVVSAQRESRHGESVFKRATAGLFYRLMRGMVDPRLTPEVGDFRLFSRAAVLAVRQFREQHRFMRGLVAWLGLKEAIVRFERPARAAGETKYTLLKMLRFAWTAVSSFSALPLRLSLALGLVVTMFGTGYFAYSLFVAFVERTALHGWTSLVCLQIIFSGTTLIAVGLVGEYVARIYEESKARPLYIVSHMANCEPFQEIAARAVLLPPRAVAAGETATDTLAPLRRG